MLESILEREGVRLPRVEDLLRNAVLRALIIDSHVYAYSDDGKTFHRADGTVVQLPLTLLPAPEHNADVKLHFTGQWWDLWQSLIRHAGYSTAY